jgi:hypothetical protein
MVPRVVHVSLDGEVIATYDLPEGLRREEGLSGITLGNEGEVLVELTGIQVHQLVDTFGELAPTPLDGYIHNERLYTVLPIDSIEESRSVGVIKAGESEFEVSVNQLMGGLRILGVKPDSSFYVIVDELARGSEIRVDETIHLYDELGKLQGLARYPVQNQYTYVMHNLAMGPDGEVYALVTHPDRADVVRLTFGPTLEPILPTPTPKAEQQNNLVEVDETLDFSSSTRAVAGAGCRTVSAMVATAKTYKDHYRYYENENIYKTEQQCPDRGAPDYLDVGGPGYYYSFPYDWGSGDTPDSFDDWMDLDYAAGDTDADQANGCSHGIDCSRYVSRIWGIEPTTSTVGLEGYSSLVNIEDAAQGDILNKKLVHAVFINKVWQGSYPTIEAYESTTEFSFDRVVYTSFSFPARYNGYLVRRYMYQCNGDDPLWSSYYRSNQEWSQVVPVDDGEPLWTHASALMQFDSDVPGSGSFQTESAFVIGDTITESVWRGNQGWSRTVPIDSNVPYWDNASSWAGPVSISGLPGSGTLQTHADFVLGNTLWQSLWRGDQGRSRTVPIVNGVIQWGSASAWSSPVSISALPGSGTLQSHSAEVVGNTLHQSLWRGNQGYMQTVPIVNGVIQWGSASAWSGPISISGLEGTGDMQAAGVFVIE